MSSMTARLLALATLVGLMGAVTIAPVAAAPNPAIPVRQPVPLIASIGAGGDHSCALTTTGAALCWGSNRSGELGDGSTSSVSLPVSVVGLDSAVTAISPGTFQTCALTVNGAIWCWGRGIVFPTSLYPVPVRARGTPTPT
jgi:alpha-tubulin suppressor-like RCC1 family protein